MHKLCEFFAEDNKNLSSSRLLMFLVVLSAIVDWQHAIWLGSGKWEPNWEIVGILLGTVGAKVVQKKFETKERPGIG